MNYLNFLIPLFLVGCVTHAGCGCSDQHGDARPDRSENRAITGVVDFSVKGPVDELFVEHAPGFDFDATVERAEQALARGDYEDSFGFFLAACAREYPDNCLRAAELIEHDYVMNVPADLKRVLYRLACKEEHVTVCIRGPNSDR
jgi:hypothetical protein